MDTTFINNALVRYFTWQITCSCMGILINIFMINGNAQGMAALGIVEMTFMVVVIFAFSLLAYPPENKNGKRVLLKSQEAV